MKQKRTLKSRMVLAVVLTLILFLGAGLFFYNSFISSKLRDSYYRSATVLANALKEGVQSSLERGQMANFQRLLTRQRSIDGVEEVILYDLHGKVDMSASGAVASGTAMPAGDWQQLEETKEHFTVTREGRIHLYMPQIIVPDCLRCHHDWPQEGLGGALDLVYDEKPLTKLVDNQRNMLFGGGLALVALLSIIIYFLTSALTRPIVQMTRVMGLLAEGDLDQEVPARKRRDEIGHMAAAVEIFKENSIARRRLELALAEMADHFEGSVMSFFNDFSSEIQGVHTAVQEMQQVVGQVVASSDTARTTTEETVANVNQVNTAIDHLENSFGEMQQQIGRSSDFSRSAVEKAGEASQLGSRLENAAAEIDKVVDLIAGIAGQTNLLALNATIEASRAGEAGKGFAVVATEVKGLAAETTASTRDVTDKISEIQSFTRDSVAAVAAIASIIDQVHGSMEEVLEAVKTQMGTTAAVTESSRLATANTENVARDLDGVSSALVRSDAALNTVLEKVNALTEGGRVLRGEVADFLKQVRAM